MFSEYDDQIRSQVADVKNTGGRLAGAITAAKFLAKFAGDTPWAHLDMAGTDDASKTRGVFVKGATGIPCPLAGAARSDPRHGPRRGESIMTTEEQITDLPAEEERACATSTARR